MNHVCYACAMCMQVAAARAYALGRRLGSLVHAQLAAVRLNSKERSSKERSSKERSSKERSSRSGVVRKERSGKEISSKEQ